MTTHKSRKDIFSLGEQVPKSPTVQAVFQSLPKITLPDHMNFRPNAYKQDGAFRNSFIKLSQVSDLQLTKSMIPKLVTTKHAEGPAQVQLPNKRQSQTINNSLDNINLSGNPSGNPRGASMQEDLRQLIMKK